MLRSNHAAPARARLMNLRAIIDNLHAFTERFTGDPQPGEVGGYLVNSDGIVNNSLHVELGRGGYLPTNAATSESQVILAQGYLEAYKATGAQKFLDAALKYTDAYVKYYMLGGAYQEPARVGEFRAHWVVNGKAPLTTWGPIDFKDYQGSGAFDALVPFAAGEGLLPQGKPWSGELLRRAYFAYGPDPAVAGQTWDDVALLWKNVFSAVRVGKHYAIDLFVDADGATWRYDAAGNAAKDDAAPLDTPGRVKLKDAFSGDLKVVFATASGFVVPRNGKFDAWPMWRALQPGESNSALDAELWHTELFRDLYDLTADTRWLRYYSSAIYSLEEAAKIDPSAVFFERNEKNADPYSVGIAYGFFVGSNSKGPIYRDADGYIRAEKGQELFREEVSWVSLEQIGVTVEVFPYSRLSIEWAGSGREAYLDVQITTEEEAGSGQKSIWRASRLFADNLGEPEISRLRVDEFVQFEKPDGTTFATATGAALTAFGEFKFDLKQGFVFDRTDLYTRVSVGGASSGAIFGFWASKPTTRTLPGALSYRLVAGRWFLRVADADGWLWWRELPQGEPGAWQELAINWADLTPSEYQANAGTVPAAPNPGPIPQVELVPPSDTTFETVSQIDLYAFGERPPRLETERTFIRELNLRAYDWRDFVLQVGNVEVENPAPTKFDYAPGVVPFTFDKLVSSGRKFWRGSPYVGYQYPAVWAASGRFEWVQDVVDFYRDAQAAYAAKFGVSGPFAPVYYWPKWDNLDFGEPNRFGWTGPDPNSFWGGFQARTFHAAAKTWADMVERNEAVPADLPGIVEGYAAWLLGFMDANNDRAPTDFPEDALPSAGYDEPHMIGLNLAAACYMVRAGSTTLGAAIRDRSFGKLMTLYQSQGEMRGSFSNDPAARLFYGFWIGEIMRALALYFQQDVEQKGKFVAPAKAPTEELIVWLEDQTGDLTLEDGSPLELNEVPAIIEFAFGLASGASLLLEAADGEPDTFLLLE